MSDFDRDVVVVGGGPSGTGAAVFAARYGFDVAVFDRGTAALPRAAFVENYPGFPAGIDVRTLRALLHDHVEETGADYLTDVVESVTHSGAGFRVETTEGRDLTARYVVAAAWYDGEYLRPVVGDDAFTPHEHDGHDEEYLDDDYADADGRTPVDGLYVAAPAGERNAQAIIAAGNGAHVARTLLADHRRAEGYPSGVAEHYDWLRPDGEFAGDWGDRERWREWFENRIPDDHDTDPDRLADLREQYIDDAFATRVSNEETERRRKHAHDRILEHLDDDRIRAYVRENRI